MANQPTRTAHPSESGSENSPATSCWPRLGSKREEPRSSIHREGLGTKLDTSPLTEGKPTGTETRWIVVRTVSQLSARRIVARGVAGDKFARLDSVLRSRLSSLEHLMTIPLCTTSWVLLVHHPRLQKITHSTGEPHRLAHDLNLQSQPLSAKEVAPRILDRRPLGRHWICGFPDRPWRT